MRAILPGLSEVAGNSEAYKRSEMRPVIHVISPTGVGIRTEAVSAVIPHAVMYKRAARITSRMRVRGGVVIFKCGLVKAKQRRNRIRCEKIASDTVPYF